MEKVNLAEKFAAFAEHWRPKIVGELNGQEVKLVKFQGEFPWHHHEKEDELFLVWRGRMRIEFRDRVVELNAGEFLVVPHGVGTSHRGRRRGGGRPLRTGRDVNTGSAAESKFTAPAGVHLGSASF